MSERRLRRLSQKLLFCLEDPEYRDYVASQFRLGDDAFVDYDKFVFQVAENPQGILVLQSETHENDLIEISKKLKRLFSESIRIILLSSDYQVFAYARSVVDAFLQFPVSRDDLAATIRELAERKRRLLVIDDSQLVHKHLSPPLVAEGYEVFSAFDGQEGVDRARELVPDLIICDIEMPRLNGFEACRAIRQMPALRDIPIIMSSTLTSVTDQRRGFAVGIDEYVPKPVNVPDLIARLENIFKQTLTGRENILILEPDALLARTIAKSLGRQGFSPRVCVSIAEATKVLRKFTHELVLSEADLPDGNALELLKALKALPSTANTGLLVLTEQDIEAEAKMLKKAGAHGLIPKPFNHDTLLAGVERTLAKIKAGVEKAHIEKYVSKASRKMALEKSILSGGENASWAYRRNASIFFSDIVNFTNRCERYSPREIVDQINTLFSVMTRVITETGGDIDKFIGDACMAFWMDEDPVKSSQSALGFLLRIRDALDTMNASDPALQRDPIRIRMGLNTGEVILADIGAAEARIDLTMIGDTVNLAARLESASKQYGLDNLVSGFALAPHRQTLAARPIDLIKVKGKDQPVEVFELLGRWEGLEPRLKQLAEGFEGAVAQYRAGRFTEALAGFEATRALESQPEGPNPSTVLAERCRVLQAQPPEAWDGVWTLTAK